MTDRRQIEQSIPFEGGVTSDGITTERAWEDMENLVPIPGKRGRLRPRQGVQNVITIDGMVPGNTTRAYQIKVADSTRATLVVAKSRPDGNRAMFIAPY